jgi:hypothetical protein
MARIVTSAPPRSFAILEGAYRYDCSAFWQIVPPITGVLFLVALAANRRTHRRNLLLGAVTLFLIGGAVAGFHLEAMPFTLESSVRAGTGAQVCRCVRAR